MKPTILSTILKAMHTVRTRPTLKLTFAIPISLLLGGCTSAPLSEVDRRALTDYAICERIDRFTKAGATNQRNINYRTSVLDERDRRRLNCNLYESELRAAEQARIAANPSSTDLLILGSELMKSAQPQASTPPQNIIIQQQRPLPPVNIPSCHPFCGVSR
jgi:hypothetical protein